MPNGATMSRGGVMSRLVARSTLRRSSVRELRVKVPSDGHLVYAAATETGIDRPGVVARQAQVLGRRTKPDARNRSDEVSVLLIRAVPGMSPQPTGGAARNLQPAGFVGRCYSHGRETIDRLVVAGHARRGGGHPQSVGSHRYVGHGQLHLSEAGTSQPGSSQSLALAFRRVRPAPGRQQVSVSRSDSALSGHAPRRSSVSYPASLCRDASRSVWRRASRSWLSRRI